jgi:hypothetical protein
VIFPLPVLAAICLYYLLAVYIPIHRSLSALNAAARNEGNWEAVLDPQWNAARKESADPAYRLAVANRIKAFIDQKILPKLHEACTADPGNVVPLAELSTWMGRRWKLSPDLTGVANAIGPAERAVKLDPEGRTGYLALHQLHLLFAEFSPSGSKEHLRQAADAMRQVVRLDPTAARLRYQLADVLSQAGAEADARIQAEHALRLDGVSSDRIRKLTSSERARARGWAGLSPTD